MDNSGFIPINFGMNVSAASSQAQFLHQLPGIQQILTHNASNKAGNHQILQSNVSGAPAGHQAVLAQTGVHSLLGQQTVIPAVFGQQQQQQHLLAQQAGIQQVLSPRGVFTANYQLIPRNYTLVNQTVPGGNLTVQLSPQQHMTNLAALSPVDQQQFVQTFDPQLALQSHQQQQQIAFQNANGQITMQSPNQQLSLQSPTQQITLQSPAQQITLQNQGQFTVQNQTLTQLTPQMIQQGQANNVIVQGQGPTGVIVQSEGLLSQGQGQNMLLQSHGFSPNCNQQTINASPVFCSMPNISPQLVANHIQGLYTQPTVMTNQNPGIISVNQSPVFKTDDNGNHVGARRDVAQKKMKVSPQGITQTVCNMNQHMQLLAQIANQGTLNVNTSQQCQSTHLQNQQQGLSNVINQNQHLFGNLGSQNQSLPSFGHFLLHHQQQQTIPHPFLQNANLGALGLQHTAMAQLIGGQNVQNLAGNVISGNISNVIGGNMCSGATTHPMVGANITSNLLGQSVLHASMDNAHQQNIGLHNNAINMDSHNMNLANLVNQHSNIAQSRANIPVQHNLSQGMESDRGTVVSPRMVSFLQPTSSQSDQRPASTVTTSNTILAGVVSTLSTMMSKSPMTYVTYGLNTISSSKITSPTQSVKSVPSTVDSLSQKPQPSLSSPGHGLAHKGRTNQLVGDSLAQKLTTSLSVKQEDGCPLSIPRPVGLGPPAKTIVVPYGWVRALEADNIVYYSPTCTRLTCLQSIRQYLSTDGTCKCGLTCPLHVEEVFDFDTSVISVKYTLAHSAVKDCTASCNHRQKVQSLPNLQMRALSVAGRADTATVTNSDLMMSPRVSSMIQGQVQDGKQKHRRKVSDSDSKAKELSSATQATPTSSSKLKVPPSAVSSSPEAKLSVSNSAVSTATSLILSQASTSPSSVSPSDGAVLERTASLYRSESGTPLSIASSLKIPQSPNTVCSTGLVKQTLLSTDKTSMATPSCLSQKQATVPSSCIEVSKLPSTSVTTPASYVLNEPVKQTSNSACDGSSQSTSAKTKTTTDVSVPFTGMPTKVSSIQCSASTTVCSLVTSTATTVSTSVVNITPLSSRSSGKKSEKSKKSGGRNKVIDPESEMDLTAIVSANINAINQAMMLHEANKNALSNPKPKVTDSKCKKESCSAKHKSSKTPDKKNSPSKTKSPHTAVSPHAVILPSPTRPKSNPSRSSTSSNLSSPGSERSSSTKSSEKQHSPRGDLGLNFDTFSQFMNFYGFEPSTFPQMFQQEFASSPALLNKISPVRAVHHIAQGELTHAALSTGVIAQAVPANNYQSSLIANMHKLVSPPNQQVFPSHLTLPGLPGLPVPGQTSYQHGTLHSPRSTASAKLSLSLPDPGFFLENLPDTLSGGTKLGDIVWLSPPSKSKSKKAKAKKDTEVEIIKVPDLFDSDVPPPNVDVSQLKDKGHGLIPKQKIASFLDNPTEFLKQQTELVNNSISSTSSSPKPHESEEVQLSVDSSGRKMTKRSESANSDRISSPFSSVEISEGLADVDDGSTDENHKISSSTERDLVMDHETSASSTSLPDIMVPVKIGTVASDLHSSNTELLKPVASAPPMPTTVVHHTPASLSCHQLSLNKAKQHAMLGKESKLLPGMINPLATMLSDPTIGHAFQQMFPQFVHEAFLESLGLAALPTSAMSTTSQNNIPVSQHPSVTSMESSSRLSLPVSSNAKSSSGGQVFSSSSSVPNHATNYPIQQILNNPVKGGEFPASNLLSAAARAQLLQQQNPLGLLMAQQISSGQVQQFVNQNISGNSNNSTSQAIQIIQSSPVVQPQTSVTSQFVQQQSSQPVQAQMSASNLVQSPQSSHSGALIQPHMSVQSQPVQSQSTLSGQFVQHHSSIANQLAQPQASIQSHIAANSVHLPVTGTSLPVTAMSSVNQSSSVGMVLNQDQSVHGRNVFESKQMKIGSAKISEILSKVDPATLKLKSIQPHVSFPQTSLGLDMPTLLQHLQCNQHVMQGGNTLAHPSLVQSQPGPNLQQTGVNLGQMLVNQMQAQLQNQNLPFNAHQVPNNPMLATSNLPFQESMNNPGQGLVSPQMLQMYQALGVHLPGQLQQNQSLDLAQCQGNPLMFSPTGQLQQFVGVSGVNSSASNIQLAADKLSMQEMCSSVLGPPQQHVQIAANNQNVNMFANMAHPDPVQLQASMAPVMATINGNQVLLNLPTASSAQDNRHIVSSSMSQCVPSNIVSSASVMFMHNNQNPPLQMMAPNHMPLSSGDKSALLTHQVPQPGLDLQQLLQSQTHNHYPGASSGMTGSNIQNSNQVMPLNLINVQQSFGNGNNLTAMQLQTLQLQQQLLQQIQQVQGMQSLINQYNLQGMTGSNIPFSIEKDNTVSLPATTSALLTSVSATAVPISHGPAATLPRISNTTIARPATTTTAGLRTPVSSLSPSSSTVQASAGSPFKQVKTSEDNTLRKTNRVIAAADTTDDCQAAKTVDIGTETEVFESEDEESADNNEDVASNASDLNQAIGEVEPIASSSEAYKEIIVSSANKTVSMLIATPQLNTCLAIATQKGNSKEIEARSSTHRTSEGLFESKRHCRSELKLRISRKHLLGNTVSNLISKAKKPKTDTDHDFEAKQTQFEKKELRSSTVAATKASSSLASYADLAKDKEASSSKPSLSEEHYKVKSERNEPKLATVVIDSDNEAAEKIKSDSQRCRSSDETPECDSSVRDSDHDISFEEKDRKQLDITNQIAEALSSQRGSWQLSQQKKDNGPESSTVEGSTEDVDANRDYPIPTTSAAGEEEEEEEDDYESAGSRGIKRMRNELEEDTASDEDEMDESTSQGSVETIPRSFSPGDLVWGQIRGFPSWPGKLVDETDLKVSQRPDDGKLLVCWFGDHTVTQVDPMKLKTLSEGLEAHHRARRKHRKGRKMNSNLEQAIQQAMAELDRQAADLGDTDRLEVSAADRLGKHGKKKQKK